MRHPSTPDASIVDYSQPAARKYLGDHAVENVLQSGLPLVYLDSVSHQECGFPMPWATTMAAIKEMTDSLHALGKRAIINAAWVPGITSNTSVDQFLASGVDGVSLEMSFHPNVRASASRVRTAIGQYRRILDAGRTVIFFPIPTTTGDGALADLETEQRLHAAFGMMFRKPGDRLFTSQLFWRPSPEWADWPERFGPALGNAIVTTNARGEVVMWRRFRNYTLALNAATKEVRAVRVGSTAVAPAARPARLAADPVAAIVRTETPSDGT